MIDKNRPLKTVWHPYSVNDAFENHTRETIDTDSVDVSDEALRVYQSTEACSANWYENDGQPDFDGYQHKARVKCMEVARYYVGIGPAACPAGGAGSYCEFHRPRICDV